MTVHGVTGPGGPAWPDPDLDADSTSTGVDTDLGAGLPERGPSLPKGFSGNEILAAVARGERDLGRGEKGEHVELLQAALYRTGLAVAGGIDGDFGRGTESAIASFQRSVGLPASGRLDAETAVKLGAANTTRVVPARDPLTASPQSYLRTQAERDAYKTIERLSWTGSSWARGIDLAVTNEDATKALDLLDTLPPASYNRVLHALAATPSGEPMNPTALDKLIRRGIADVFNVRISARFCQQLVDKLGNEPEPDRKILSHISEDTTDRLRGWASWNSLVQLFS